jgi:hypothetical protein
VLAQHLETFLAHTHAGDRRVPAHVERELIEKLAALIPPRA